jgi:hypothetical protein
VAFVANLHGEPGFLLPPHAILAATAAIHPQVLEVLQGE